MQEEPGVYFFKLITLFGISLGKASANKNYRLADSPVQLQGVYRTA